MTYLVLARKWRPRSFETLVGQDHVVRALTHALSTQRLHHAWLFTGTRGVGKTTLSRILAKSLNCHTGITPTPCGECPACTEIDAGRFVDYVELDAASNRGVEEMTQLLEQAVYAPSSARFKVYMIDEVHMLSGHAFNAMLKTLEEPPAHVKFILATTDPQKIPVTVLSRCLQFNLKQMTPDAIVQYLETVLSQEGINHEVAALRLLARAAAGSMRDALSLTDQAIAYSGGDVSAQAIQDMLGTIDQGHLVQLLGALSAGDAPGIIEVADQLAMRGLSYSGALADLAVLLSRIAIEQRVPGSAATDDPLHDDIQTLARTLDADQVQLFYSVAVHSRQELSLAPDEYAGFVMACLRMLALGPSPAPAPGAGDRQPEYSGTGSTTPEATPAPAASGGPAQMGAAAHRPLHSSAGLSERISTSVPTPVPAPEPVSAPASAPAPEAAEASVASRVGTAAASVPGATRSDASESGRRQPEAPTSEIHQPESREREQPDADIRAAERTQPDVQRPGRDGAGSAPSTANGSASGAAASLVPLTHAALENKAFQDGASQGDAPETASADGDVPPWEDIPLPDDAGAYDSEEFETVMPEALAAALSPELVDGAESAPASSPLTDITAADWPRLVEQLPLTGLVAELAHQSEWLGAEGSRIRLRMGIATLGETSARTRLRTILSEHFGTAIELDIDYAQTGDETVHAIRQAERAKRQRQAEQAVHNDPFVNTLITDFGGQLVSGSIRAV